jgi:hypothetical protein
MPNSNSTNTRTELIQAAFRRIGMDNPSTNEIGLAVGTLNDLVAELDPEGRWLWAISNTETELTLVAGTRSYSVGTAPTGIASGILNLETVVLYRSSGAQRIPLKIIDKTESINSFELETTSGEPYLVYLETAPNAADQKIHFLPTPSTADTVKYTFQRSLYDFDSASDTPDFKRSMRLSLQKILSYELSPQYGVPAGERQLLALESAEARRKLFAHNSEKVTCERTQIQYF